MQYAVGGAPAVVGAKIVKGVSRQRGATLVEIVLYLAVAAIVIFAVFSLFGTAFGSSKSQTETQNLQGIVGSVNTMYGTSKDYPDGVSLMPTLIQSKAVPSTMVIAGDNLVLRNSWGGGVTAMGSGTYYILRYEGVPRRACVEMARTPINFLRASINGNLYTPGRLTADQATSFCGSDQENVLIWDIR